MYSEIGHGDSYCIKWLNSQIDILCTTDHCHDRSIDRMTPTNNESFDFTSHFHDQPWNLCNSAFNFPFLSGYAHIDHNDMVFMLLTLIVVHMCSKLTREIDLSLQGRSCCNTSFSRINLD